MAKSRRAKYNIKADPEQVIPSRQSPRIDSPTRTISPGPNDDSQRYSAAGSSMHAFKSFIRSDAPTPSEAIAEVDTEPLLMETRGRRAEESAILPREDVFTNSFRDIAQKLKAFNDTLGELHQLGVQEAVSLPELVLVGDQSAGKSSLMSGLAELSLPRSEGACTRCPIHIRLSRDKDWSCNVSLQRNWAYLGTDAPISEEDVTDDNPFPPWAKRGRSSHNFKTIFNKNEIDEVLRWAQIAILNDRQNPDLYVPGTGAIATNSSAEEAAELTEAKFSPNIVALSIKGPDLPDLSFYDMPGIFHSAMREQDQYLAKVVQYLTREYVKHQAAIIICALPMNNDAELSSSFNILRQMKALPRAIGVLTKADLLSKATNLNQWLQILRGETYETGHGYFITSRPSDKFLEDQTRWEEYLFDVQNHGDWPEQFREFHNRCGVERLKVFLSEMLGREFAKSLPSVKYNIINRLDRVNEMLGELPELPPNVQHEVKKSLYEFSAKVRDRLSNQTLFAGSNFAGSPERFQAILLSMKPTYILKDPAPTVIDMTEDDSDSGLGSKRPAPSMQPPVNTPKRQRIVPANGPSTPPVKREIDSANPTASRPQPHSQQPPVRAMPLFDPPFDKWVPRKIMRNLQQLRDVIRSKTRPGMPNVIPQEVYEQLCVEALSDWHKPMDALLSAMVEKIHKVVVESLEDSMGALRSRLIYKESLVHIKMFLEQERKTTLEFLHKLCKLECDKLFTINTNNFDREKQDEARLIRAFRHHQRWEAYTNSRHEFKDPATMTAEELRGYEKSREAELLKLGVDQFENELQVASYVRGYYRIAAFRFADMVSLVIIADMLPRITGNLAFDLDSRLGLLNSRDDTVFQRLMEEDRQTAAKRNRLRSDKEKFEKALRSIESLEAQFGSVDAAGLALHRHESEVDVAMGGVD